MIVFYNLPEMLRKVNAEEEIINRALGGEAKIQIYDSVYSFSKDLIEEKLKRKLSRLNIKASVYWVYIEDIPNLKIEDPFRDFIFPSLKTFEKKLKEHKKSAKKCAEKVHRHLEKTLDGEYLDNHTDPSVAKVVIHDFSMSTPMGISTGRKYYNDYILINIPYPRDIKVLLDNPYLLDLREYIYDIILHEFGHKLGLEHVSEEFDIMYPYGLKSSWFFRLIFGERNFVSSAIQWYRKKKIFEKYLE